MITLFFTFFLEILTIVLLMLFDTPFIALSFLVIVLVLSIAHEAFLETLSNMTTYVDFKSLNFKERSKYVIFRIIKRNLNFFALIFIGILSYFINHKFGFIYPWAVNYLELFGIIFVCSIIITAIVEVCVNLYMYRK